MIALIVAALVALSTGIARVSGGVDSDGADLTVWAGHARVSCGVDHDGAGFSAEVSR